MVTFFWPFPKGENRFGNDAGKGIWYDRMSRFFSELCCLEKTERKGFFCLSAVNSGVWHVYGPCSVLQMHRELAKEEAVRQQRMWNSSSKLRKKGFKLIWLTLNCIRFFLKNWTKTASSAKNEPTSIIFFSRAAWLFCGHLSHGLAVKNPEKNSSKIYTTRHELKKVCAQKSKVWVCFCGARAVFESLRIWKFLSPT